jgi:two-component system cell cycle sensor histidine kinase/response regulator CckA
VRHPKNGEHNPNMIPSEPGGYTRARRLLSLSTVVRDALPVMRVAVANTAVLRIEMDAHAPLVEVNAIAIHRVLMKLVLNASQAIRQPHGVIEIGVAGMISSDYPNRPFVRLTVADNGIGMDSATVGNLRQQLLEPADAYGAGLGLRIVHRAIRAHGGQLQIDSQPGRGTTVRIDLPAAPQGSGVSDSGACEGEDPNSTGHQSA